MFYTIELKIIIWLVELQKEKIETKANSLAIALLEKLMFDGFDVSYEFFL